MRMDSKAAEEAAVLHTAQAMCAAARTAPKARGIDEIHTAILTGSDKEELAEEMDKMGDSLEAGFFHRDANNVRESEAVVLIGTTYKQRGLSEVCQLCNNHTCAECAEKDAVCVFDPLDLGIAIGSAVALAARDHIDNRILFSGGKAAYACGFFDPDVMLIMAIPLSCTGKNPFFDRSRK